MLIRLALCFLISFATPAWSAGPPVSRSSAGSAIKHTKKQKKEKRRKQEELDALNGLIQEGGFAAAIEVSEDTIDKMVQRTGFSRDECRASLGQVAGNVEAAIEMLMELGGGAA